MDIQSLSASATGKPMLAYQADDTHHLTGAAGITTALSELSITPSLFRLPVELKDMIYAHLVDSVPKHHIFKSKVTFGLTPAFTRVSKQAYNECMPIYLARIDFIVEDRRHNSPLSRTRNRDDRRIFVKSLLRLGPDRVRMIRSITIEYGHYDMVGISGDTGVVGRWFRLIRVLVETGVEAHQLKWPGLMLERDHSHLYHPHQVITDTVLFYKNVLPQVLRDHHLLSPYSPIADVDGQAATYFGNQDRREDFLLAISRKLQETFAAVAGSMAKVKEIIRVHGG